MLSTDRKASADRRHRNTWHTEGLPNHATVVALSDGGAMDFSSVGKVCSFCGKVGKKGTEFAGGLGAMMCRDCVEYYADVFASAEKVAAVRRPPWDNMTDTEMLAQLPLIAATTAQVDDFLHDWVALLRARKISWAQIGKVMGVSRQAAWERFAKSVAASEKGASSA